MYLHELMGPIGVQVPLDARRMCQISAELELQAVVSHHVGDGN